MREIKDALAAKTKFDNSKVVEGRLLALKADQSKLNDYAKKAEELADSLKRALVLEGIPQSKANEMAIDKTVELCRSNARSDMVRGILAITETTEKQILQFRRQNNQNVRGHGFQYNRYGYQNNDNNNFGNNQNFRGNYRGRGRGRGRGYPDNFGQRQNNQIFFTENEQAPPPGAEEQQNVVALQADEPN